MSSTATDQKLTKKQKKAAAFRSSSKGKAKATTSEESSLEVPEPDDLEAAESAVTPDVSEVSVKEKNDKKRKREDGNAITAEEGDGEGERKKKRQRGKKKSAQGANGADGKPRLILFVGQSRSNSSFVSCVRDKLTKLRVAFT